MYYYKYNNKILVSDVEYKGFDVISEKTAAGCPENIYWLYRLDPIHSRRSFLVSDPSLLFRTEEGPSLLSLEEDGNFPLPEWLLRKIHEGRVCAINTLYPNWKEVLEALRPQRWRVNIAGLGDVGGILLTGLRLLGGEDIKEIGIYDLDSNKVNRWRFEVSQILPPNKSSALPIVKSISEDEIFNCDMFVFCVSLGVPPLGNEHRDVRMAQYEGNSRIISSYAKRARNSSFKGIFAVVSDPVDLLCRSAFIASNENDNGELDFMGLAPEQIRGYGLGVMNARAAFFASEDERFSSFLDDGRVYGPHGEGLIVANSIENYDDLLSVELTEKTKAANIEIRKTGFKPYIAPALSSGSLSLLATIRGDWHYSATFMGGVFMGSRNRLTSLGTELERLKLAPPLLQRIQSTYKYLSDIL